MHRAAAGLAHRWQGPKDQDLPLLLLRCISRDGDGNGATGTQFPRSTPTRDAGVEMAVYSAMPKTSLIILLLKE